MKIKKYIAMLCLMLLSLNSFASVKQLRCEMTREEQILIRDFIFDTDDFSKEKPEADTVLVETNRDKNELWIDEDDAKLFGVPPVTHYQLLGVGNTYRTTFEVTPTFLTFMYVRGPECKSSLKYKSPSLCQFLVDPIPMSISRKTLKGQDDAFDPPWKFSCEISDYSVDENQI